MDDEKSADGETATAEEIQELMRVAQHQARHSTQAMLARRSRRMIDVAMGRPARIASPDSGFESEDANLTFTGL